MIRFHAATVHYDLDHLKTWAEDDLMFASYAKKGRGNAFAALMANVEKIEKVAKEFGMVETLGRCDRFAKTLAMCIGIKLDDDKDPIPLRSISQDEIKSEIEGILEAFWKETKYCHFLFLPKNVAGYYEQEALFGESVLKSFPSAKQDVREAGNCFATGLNTAAVIHLMFAANAAVLALTKHLKVKIKNPEHQDWGPLLKAIEAKLEHAHGLGRGPKKQKEVEFYADILGELRALKDVHRNSVSHARKRYNEPEALGVLERVKALMQRLATRLSE